MAGIQIKITTDVNNVTQGFSAVEVRATQLKANIEKLQSVIANTTSQRKLESALTALGQQQSLLNNVLSKSPEALKKLGASSNQSTNALMNLSRVAQDAPYGFIGIANNINPLLESFQRLKATTGTTGSALKEMGSQLMGPAGLGLAVGVVSSLLVVFGDKLANLGGGVSKFAKIMDDAKSSFVESYTSVAQLASQIKLARDGFISKEAVVKKYNETIGKTTGLVNSLDEAESSIIKNGPAYVMMTLKKAIAAIALQKAAEKAFEQEVLREAFERDKAKMAGFVEDILQKKINRRINTLEKEKILLQDIGLEMNSVSAEISKIFGFNFFGDNKDITIKPTKIKIKKPDKVELSDIKTEYELSSPITVKVPELKISATDMFPEELGRFSDKGLKPYDKSFWDAVEAHNQELKERFEKSMKDLQNDFRNAIASAGFESIGESIGEALAGGEVKNAFQAFAQFVGQAVKALGQQMIRLGVAAVLAKQAIKKLFSNPVIAIGAGVALVAVGAAMEKLLSKGVSYRASGGPVSAGRPYMVGEVGRELFIPSTSGRIVPNNGLGSLIGGAMQLVNVTVNGRISGRDLVLVQARETGYQTRNV